MPEELIRGFDIRLESPACHPGAELCVAYLDLHDDISPLMPYLNAELEQPTDYRHNDHILLWEHHGHAYAFRPREIAIAGVAGYEQASALAAVIVARANDIWQRRDGIVPSTEGRRPLPNVLDLYKLLPRLNCKECGFPTCMAFAAALRTDLAKAPLCPHLTAEALRKVAPGA